jgi:predicted AAA+ superfamily ATPase
MKNPDDRKVGRPRVPVERKKRVQVSVAMTAHERTKLEAVAKVKDQSISELLMSPWRKGNKK